MIFSQPLLLLITYYLLVNYKQIVAGTIIGSICLIFFNLNIYVFLETLCQIIKA